ncbi:hypothetical protein [Aureivirga sp. CE67]|uniref:hypothetical protein n=1 Tax=Aureivirga sp. CE67 TaxID=1788983 RepID=UPI0018C932F8|nr:hypothetical protein [Aureivirga sp. CE67]
MKIKQIFFTVLFIAFSLSTFSQNHQEVIKKEFSEYISLLEKFEFEKSLDYVMPEFFEIASKEMILKEIEAAFNDPEIELKFGAIEILSVNEPKNIDGKMYSVIKYNQNILLKMNSAEEVGTEEEKQEMLDFMLVAFQAQFGKENVTYNKETGFFQIFAEKTGVAATKSDIIDWKFITKEEGQDLFLKKILPTEILNDMN